VTLESALQSLVLDPKHPVALEIAGTATDRRFLLRATTPAACEHARRQLRMRYPQADMREVTEDDDPLTLKPGEAVSVIELQPGAPSYLPMREVPEEAASDPILGLLAALTVPADMRAIAQIALAPAPPTWSRGSLRKALEHPLQQEQQRLPPLQQQPVPNTFGLVAPLVVLLLLFLYFRVRLLIPSWVSEVIISVLLRGQMPQLSGTQGFLLIGGIICLVGGFLLTFLGIDLIKRGLFPTALYDPRLVAHKTSRVAYRTRIRLYVISPGTAHPTLNLLAFGLTHGSQVFSQHSAAWQAMKTERAWSRKQAARRADVLTSLCAAYRQFHLASGGYFVPKKLPTWHAQLLVQPRPGWHLAPWSGWACDVARSTHYIVSDFLSLAWRLPSGDLLADLPGLEHKQARTLLVPPALIARQGSHLGGFSTHAGHAFPFAFPGEILTSHTFIGGKSGTGKSTVIAHLAQKAMWQPDGPLCLFDMHGDLAEQVLTLVPAHRVADVVYVDLGDADYAVACNPLDVTTGRERDVVVSSLLSIFQKLWPGSWGNRMAAPFRASLLTLFEANAALVRRYPLTGPDQQHTLLDLVSVLTDESFWSDLLSDVQDKFVHRFWHTYFSNLSELQRQERVDPVITKMAQFEMKAARHILGQGHSTLDFHQIIKEHKILIVRLAGGEVGTDTAALLGSFFIGMVLAALREQRKQRVRVPIIIDEAQTLPGTDYAQLLAELRKFGASAIIGTQSFEYLQQLDPLLLPAISTSIQNFLIYRMSAADARIICGELGVTPDDIVNLDAHQCYARLTYQGKQQPTFSLQVNPPDPGEPSQIETIREASRKAYSRPIADVEAALLEQMGRNISASLHHKAQAQAQKDEKQAKKASKGPWASKKKQPHPSQDGQEEGLDV
jgi:hypothetical protein